jgi:hypothetical protein
VGRDLESAIEDFAEKAEQHAKNMMGQPKPPSPEETKAKTEEMKAQSEIARQQIENQGEQANAKMDFQSKQLDMQMKEIELEIQELRTRAEVGKIEHERGSIDREHQIATQKHAQEMEKMGMERDKMNFEHKSAMDEMAMKSLSSGGVDAVKSLHEVAQNIMKAAEAIHHSVEKMHMPKRIVRDPKTGLAMGLEVVKH